MESFKYDDPVPPYSPIEHLPDENTPLCATEQSLQLRGRPIQLPRRWNTNWPRKFLYFVGTSLFLILVYVSLSFSNPYIPGELLPPGVQPSHPDKPPVRVAIVGAGPAGIAAAFQLSNGFRSEASSRNVEVVVFEERESVGGRMVINADLGEMWFSQSRITTGDLAGGDLFSQGSIIKQRAERHLGSKFENDWESEGKIVEVGFYDGKTIVSKVTRPMDKISWSQWTSLLWRYGWKIPEATIMPTKTMKGFENLLKTKDTFEGIKEIVEKVGIIEAVAKNAKDTLKTDDWSQLYREEVVEQQIRRQIGQGTEEISDLAFNIALSREYQGLRTGGMLEDVFAQFLTKSGADVRLSTKVTCGKYEGTNGQKNGRWRLHLTNGTQANELFDKVIKAGPCHGYLDNYYRNVWNAFIVTSGHLKKSYFGIDDDTTELPSQILVIDSPDLAPELKGVREISYVKDIYGPDLGTQSVHKLYRIQSDTKISEDLIAQFGGSGVSRVVQVEIPHAYPLLFPRSEGLENFKVEESYYCTGFAEMVASSVDLSEFSIAYFDVHIPLVGCYADLNLVGWIAGENVAKLIRKEIDDEERKMS